MKEKKLAAIIVLVLLGVLMSAPVWSGDEEGIREAIRIVRDRFNVRDWESLVGKIEEIKVPPPVAPVEGGEIDSLVFSAGAGDVQERGFDIPVKLTPAQKDTIQQLERLGWIREEILGVVGGMSREGGFNPVEPAPGDTLLSGAFGEKGKTSIVQPQRLYAFKLEKIYHDYVTTCEEEYPLEERKVMKGELREVFEEIPPEVGLFLDVQEIKVSGAHATAHVAYYFKAMADTERSKRYLALGRQKMTLQLDKRDERWKLKAVKGLVNTMKTAVKAK